MPVSGFTTFGPEHQRKNGEPMIYEKHSFRRDSLPAFVQDFLTDDMLLFDIETTGLSPAQDRIYCIGCGTTLGEEIFVELFFAETSEDEADVLSSFFRLLDTHTILITFNGATFDIPFINRRMASYGQERDLLPGAREHIDLYREVVKMKDLLALPSYRQKSLQEFLGCEREDPYNGGQLIAFYQEYTKCPDPDLLAPILLHNREDVAGMFDLLSILSYRQFRYGQFAVTDMDEESDDGRPFFNVKLKPVFPLPRSIHRIFAEKDGISFLLDRDACLIRFPIRHGELKHFFDDPQNYYYLPEEDTAIHKSVGEFVDKPYRKKATKSTCYIKSECDYLMISAKSDKGSLRKEYADKNTYLKIPAAENEVREFLSAFFSMW